MRIMAYITQQGSESLALADCCFVLWCITWSHFYSLTAPEIAIRKQTQAHNARFRIHTHTLTGFMVRTRWDPSLKVDWRTEADVLLTLETWVGQETQRVGRFFFSYFIYLPGKCLALWSPQAAQHSPVYLYYCHCKLLQRAVVPRADDCPRQREGWTLGNWGAFWMLVAQPVMIVI